MAAERSHGKGSVGRLSRVSGRLQLLDLATAEIASARVAYQLAEQLGLSTVGGRMQWDEGERHERLAARMLEPSR